MNSNKILLAIVITILVISMWLVWHFVKPLPPVEVVEEPVKVEKKIVKKAAPKSYWGNIYHLETQLERLYSQKKRGVISEATYKEREAQIFQAYQAN